MCGIFGIVHTPDTSACSAAGQKMANALKHRGPDDFGKYESSGVFLGMVRLAIVDLTAGNQPIYNEDGTLLIIFNGEIYNH
jgi:asparagine synthase (glutamine-hydrolysing)